MSLDIDTQHAHRRPTELKRVVEAVIAALPSDEADWIEWKSTLDLTAAAGRFHIARAILALANRDPHVANRHVGGLGYVIVGAEPGTATGITPIDIATLDPWITAYTGDEGPSWFPIYLTVNDKQILMVVVEPPKDGDPIHSLRKTFQGDDRKQSADNGTIFIRRGARSTRAIAVDIEMLQRRLLSAGEDPGLSLEVSAVGGPASLAFLDTSQLESDTWLNGRIERALSEYLERAKELRSKRSASDALVARGLGPFTPDALTATYKSSLQRHREAVDVGDIRLECARVLRDEQRNRFSLHVVNTSERNLKSIQIVGQIRGGVPFRQLPDRTLPKLPKGPTMNDLLGRNLVIDPASLPGPFPPRLLGSPKARERTFVEGQRVTYHLGDLRPRGESSAEWVCVLPEEAAVSVRWTVTCENRDGLLSGETLVGSADGGTLTPSDLLAWDL